MDLEQNTNQQTLFRINLPYNVNQAINPQSWDSSFYPILLYSSMEYILSNIENIKVSLMRVSDYIINKSVDRGKVNDFDNLKDVGKITWDLISVIYKAG